ncbi:DUF4145 domain-containing protein [Cytophagaceae bacterium SJW1-29]|uniref:DUF4145 domain-containing protein n=1 Tax=Salmonirosea aquatica TaxID=2654236 RepID=A0A7C9FPR5_9BACT|nr:DUF4145 domain-containing protein [Cytophagaceae bacterium SJW1-29]
MTFSGVLNCKSCHEFVAISGTGTIEDFEYYDQFTGEYDRERFEIFTPAFFYPPLPIFKIPEKCPPLIKDEIILSFALFWVDLSSCANKIRTAIEILLTQEKVKRSVIKNKKRRRLNLHDRIVEYQKKNSQIAEYLLAIKWIGNTGSHVGTLSQTDILDAYELLDFSLRKLYDNNEQTLNKMIKEINKRKGTRKK